MGNLLKEALKNLCGANQWSYAVFWKISCQNPKLLIWEECFYERISQSSLQGISRIVDPGIDFEGYNARGFSTRSQVGDNLHLLINKMMADNHVNIVGEGYNNSSLNHLNGVQSSVLDMTRQYKSVGRAALTGNHQWILSEDDNREAQPPEVLQERYIQFSAGIQTVAVIPVLHHGVVQLGSFFSMAENVQFVNDVKTSVLQLHQDPSILLSGNHAAKGLPLQIGAPVFLGNSTSEGLSGISNLINSTPFIPESCNYVETSKMSSGMFTSGELRPDFVLAKRKHEFEPQSSSFTNTEYEDAYMETQSGDDLFDVLGIDFKNKLYNGDWSDNSNKASDSNRGNVDDNNSPSVQSQVNASEIHALGHGSDYLLDAVVSDVHSSVKQLSDESVSRMRTLKNLGSNYGTNAEFPHGQVQVVDQIKEELGGVSEYLVKTEAMSSCSFLSGSSMDYPGTYSPSSFIYGLQISSSISKGYDIKPSSSASTGYSKNPDEKSKTNRKKPKPGESPRPRPKDRQMIQDRVKELREIVPNGAKCSIDSLLEHTIKHMLFLQSVTKHADKLKLIGEPKIISKDGSVLSKDKFEGGATWAYEVGSQSMICPIIVEDLNEPRQMLVEMLCETRGLFLEIADIIRGLGLTIVKGVMETWNDKIWAHFAVEANRDVTRMEVFVSLVHLLEQNAKSGIQPAKDISKDIP